MPTASTHTIMMNMGDLLSVMWAFMANTIPKNRSHDMRVKVMILDTKESTAKEKETHKISMILIYNCHIQ